MTDRDFLWTLLDAMRKLDGKAKRADLAALMALVQNHLLAMSRPAGES